MGILGFAEDRVGLFESKGLALFLHGRSPVDEHHIVMTILPS